MNHLIKRLISHQRLKKSVGIWFHPLNIFHMDHPQNVGDISNRPKFIVTTLIHNKLIKPHQFRGSKPIYWGHLHEFHDRNYVHDTIKADFDFSKIGLMLNLHEGECFRQSNRRMVQATVNGMSELVLKKLQISINLGGGFHHASPKDGAGFCLYNDIGTAIRLARKNNYDGRILIIDLDYHQGNGNLKGLSSRDNVFHFQINGETWENIHCENALEITLPRGTTDKEYLECLTQNLPPYISKISPNIVFYIAGNDVLAKDFFGRFQLSLEGIFKRDQFVINQCKEKHIPLQITLAGGYGPSSWKATTNMIQWILSGDENIQSLQYPENVERIYNKFLDHRKKNRPKKPKDWNLTENDLTGMESTEKKFHNILDYYTLSHLEYAINEVEIPKKIRQKGYKKIWLETSQKENGQDLIRMLAKVGPIQHILIEALINIQIITINHDPFIKIKLLNLEWLLAQDPLKTFANTQPELPGQEYPGLGLTNEIMQILYQTCERLNLDGIIHTPSYYHVALKTCRQFKYLNPVEEGRFRAITEILKDYSLWNASRIIEEDRLIDQNSSPVHLTTDKMIYPISSKLHDYFTNNDYVNMANHTKMITLSQLSIKEEH